MLSCGVEYTLKQGIRSRQTDSDIRRVYAEYPTVSLDIEVFANRQHYLVSKACCDLSPYALVDSFELVLQRWVHELRTPLPPVDVASKCNSIQDLRLRTG